MLIPSHLTITTLWPASKINTMNTFRLWPAACFNRLLLSQMVVHVSLFIVNSNKVGKSITDSAITVNIKPGSVALVQ